MARKTKRAQDQADAPEKTGNISGFVSLPGGETFKAGDEDKFRAAIDAERISAEDVTRLTRLGAISGFSTEDAESVPQIGAADPTITASNAGRARRADMIEERKIDEEATGEREPEAQA
jgi:hypothetical protein